MATNHDAKSGIKKGGDKVSNALLDAVATNNINPGLDQMVSVLPMSDKNNFDQAPRKPRVASYCRVSTEEEIQLGSLENQVIHYTNYIRSNKEWQFVGVFSDRGKSGTKTGSRTGFNRMIRRAMAGEIDIILCKSISRFARNVLDTLNIVKSLSEKGITVIFEKEAINTSKMSSSILLTVLALFAEEESRSISENIEWSLTKRFENGEVRAVKILGYDFNKDKEWIVVEREAVIVREAYRLFLEGKSMSEIAEIFIERGYRKKNGRIDWDGSGVRGLLTNERYTGDVLSRKTCTLDFRSHKSVVNDGHKPQYYIENHHEGIISKEDFQRVQDILSQSVSTAKGIRKKTYPLSKRLKCTNCGANFHRQENPNGKVDWICSTSKKSKKLCKMEPITQEQIEKLLIEGFYKRYGINAATDGGELKRRLMKELMNAEAARDREQNLLRVKLEKVLIKENKAVIDGLNIEPIKEKRIALEKQIAERATDWELFDRDEAFRRKALGKLKDLQGSVQSINRILDISFMRAWVIRIKIESPYLFTVKWIDGSKTVAGQFRRRYML
jgi:site-specific DNA recombinase